MIHETPFGTIFAPPSAILLVTDLEEKTLNPFEEKPMANRRYIDKMFLIGKYG